MIQIPRTTLRALRRDIRQALDVTSAKHAPAVTLRSVKDQLVIQSATDQVAFEFRLPFASSTDDSELCITVPSEVFRTCEGRTQETVTFQQHDDQINVQWFDQRIPKKLSVAATEAVPMPKAPDAFHPIGQHFLSAMAEASKTTTKEPSRFAMDCIRLRGSDGQIAASDSYQALLQAGFQFPWSDEILVASSRALQSPDFFHAPHVEIGRSDDWFFIRLEQQTLCLKIEKERRFPHVDLQIPTEGSAATTLQLSSGDATFLESFLCRMPGATDHRSPVTVELNGVVAIRATDDENLNPVELVLDDSRRDGNELRFQTNRTYLSRAAQLGFRDIYLRNSEAPAFCRDPSRTYLWALLSEHGAIPANDEMPTIHSNLPTSDSFIPQNSSIERPTELMTNNASSSQTTSARSQSPRKPNGGPTLSATTASTAEAASQCDEELTPTLLAQAETVRESLSQALTDVRELITAIKRNQKQNRLVESTLRSLKQLEHIAS